VFPLFFKACSDVSLLIDHTTRLPAYTAFNYTPGFSSFLGDFSVPALPANDPEVLYLFTGLQNIDWIPVVDPGMHCFVFITTNVSHT